MKFSEESNAGSNVIQGYDDRGININGQLFVNSLVIARNHLLDDWPVKTLQDLSDLHLQQLLDLSPEVILIGTGKRISFPHPQTYAHIINQGIGIEFMDSGAACRTYNILLSEDRDIVAGIIL